MLKPVYLSYPILSAGPTYLPCSPYLWSSAEKYLSGSRQPGWALAMWMSRSAAVPNGPAVQ